MTPKRYLTNGRNEYPFWVSSLSYVGATLLALVTMFTPNSWWTPLAIVLAVLSGILVLGLAWLNHSLRQQVQNRTQDLAQINAKLTQEIQLKDSFTEALQKNDQKLQLAMQVSQLAVWDWNIQRRRLHISGPYNGFGQRHRGAMLALREFVHQDDFPAVRRAILGHLRGNSDQLSIRYRNREQPPRWLEDIGKAVNFGHRHRPLRLLGTRRDITAEVAREQELTLAASLFSGNRDPILVLDHQFAVSAVNPAFTDLVRSSAEEWVGRHWSDCSHSELTTRIIQRLADQGHWEGELLEQRADGHAFPLHIGFRTVIANGQVSHYLGFCRDLSLHRPSRKALAAEHYDALTGLPERAYFHQQLDYYRRMDQLPPLQVAVGILNIDHFAHLNEQFGRPAGDTLLQDIAARLNQYGAPLIMVSRLNADEFGLLFSHFETPMRLNHLAMQIIADINRPVLTEQEEVLATASMGLVMLDQHNIHECMNIARAHLQHVQRKGGNGVVDASTAHPSPALNKDRAQQALHILLEQAERPQRFRPQLNASHQSFMAIRVSNLLEYEALGDIQVASLYTLAQEMRLEERLFKQLLSTACTCYQLCRQDGAPETTLLSFPVTATLLLNEHLRVMIDVVLRQEGLAPGQLELSFSASVLRHDHPAVLTQLNALHAAGFRLMLEDLEDWPATLLQLTALPIDTLRVKQPMPSQPMPPGSRENLPPSTALLAQFCLHFGWTLCLSRLDSNEQHQAVRSLPAALLPHSRLEGTVLSRATNAQDLATFVRHQTALLAVAQQVH